MIDLHIAAAADICLHANVWMINCLGRSMLKDSVQMWRRSDISGLELMRATFIRQRFARHAHERFAVGVIEAGALGFYYRGESVVAPAGAINLANPDEPHTGHAAAQQGWTYRMFYFDAEHLRDAVAQMADRPCAVPRFATGVIHDDGLAYQVRSLHQALEQDGASRLEMQSRFMAMLVALIQRHSDARPYQCPIGREPRAVQRAREYIHTHYSDDVSIDCLASIAGLSPYHFMRVFSRNVGLPPHTYLIQTRVRQARAMLQAGQRPAAAAHATGFCDQSHFTRHFKRLTGMTPGKYRRIVQETR